MSHADRPYLTRPLAGVDRALGEGRARQPVELLDQLRERLERLDQNHPSASPGPPDPDEALGRDAAADQAPVPEDGAQASRPDRSSLPKEGAEASRDGRLDDQGAGEPPADRQAGQPGTPVVGGTVNGLAGDGQYRSVDVVRTDNGERYRPWFAADEPGTPWFIE